MRSIRFRQAELAFGTKRGLDILLDCLTVWLHRPGRFNFVILCKFLNYDLYLFLFLLGYFGKNVVLLVNRIIDQVCPGFWSFGSSPFEGMAIFQAIAISTKQRASPWNEAGVLPV